MNQKQKLQMIGGLSALVGYAVISYYTNKKRKRRIAEEQKRSDQAFIRHMKSLEALEQDLADRITNGKFWLQVTEDQ